MLALFTYLNIAAGEQKRHAKDLAEIMRILGWSYGYIKDRRAKWYVGMSKSVPRYTW